MKFINTMNKLNVRSICQTEWKVQKTNKWISTPVNDKLNEHQFDQMYLIDHKNKLNTKNVKKLNPNLNKWVSEWDKEMGRGEIEEREGRERENESVNRNKRREPESKRWHSEILLNEECVTNKMNYYYYYYYY